MFVFKITKSICKGITDAISQFWWGDDVNDKKMHWLGLGGSCVFTIREEDLDSEILTISTWQ
jgi:hypothetical protein